MLGHVPMDGPAFSDAMTFIFGDYLRAVAFDGLSGVGDGESRQAMFTVRVLTPTRQLLTSTCTVPVPVVTSVTKRSWPLPRVHGEEDAGATVEAAAPAVEVADLDDGFGRREQRHAFAVAGQAQRLDEGQRLRRRHAVGAEVAAVGDAKVECA